MDKVHIAAVGTGPLAGELLCAAREAGFIIHGVWSNGYTRTQATKIARQCGQEKVYSSYEDLLKDDQVNTVYFSLAQEPYQSLVEQALQAGKHVLLEPEFTTSQEQAAELYELARINGCILFETNIYPNAASWDLLKKAVSRLGSIRLVQLSTSLLSTRIAEAAFHEKSMEGESGDGSGLLKLNLRNLSFLFELFGRPVHFDYFTNMTKGLDTSGVMVLKYPGFLATAAASRDSLGISGFIIQGTQGFIRSPEHPYSFHAFDMVLLSGVEHMMPLNHDSRKLSSELRLFRNMLKENNVELMNRRMEEKLEILEYLDLTRRKTALHGL